MSITAFSLISRLQAVDHEILSTISNLQAVHITENTENSEDMTNAKEGKDVKHVAHNAVADNYLSCLTYVVFGALVGVAAITYFKK